MPKAYLKFDMPEETEEFNEAINGGKYKLQLESIWDTMFRPYFKHGYNNEELNKLLDDKKCQRVVDLLVERYQQMIKEWED